MPVLIVLTSCYSSFYIIIASYSSLSLSFPPPPPPPPPPLLQLSLPLSLTVPLCLSPLPPPPPSLSISLSPSPSTVIVPYDQASQGTVPSSGRRCPPSQDEPAERQKVPLCQRGSGSGQEGSAERNYPPFRASVLSLYGQILYTCTFMWRIYMYMYMF